MELLIIILGTVGLGAAFFAIDRSSILVVRRFGPWLFAIVVCLTLAIVFPAGRGAFTWANLQRPGFAKQTLEGLGFLLSFAVEAVLVSHWLLLRTPAKPYVYLPSFLGITLVCWFATLLVWWAAVPGS